MNREINIFPKTWKEATTKQKIAITIIFIILPILLMRAIVSSSPSSQPTPNNSNEIAICNALKALSGLTLDGTVRDDTTLLAGFEFIKNKSIGTSLESISYRLYQDVLTKNDRMEASYRQMASACLDITK